MMGDKKMNLYLMEAELLYKKLIEKFEIDNGDFSLDNLYGLATKLRRKKLISDIDFEKIRKIPVTSDVDNLRETYQYFNVFKKDKNKTESSLAKMLKKLSFESKDSVVDASKFNEFNEYMHVKRSIQEHLEFIVENKIEVQDSSLTFIVGNVGDGKSHLLSYINNKYSDIFKNNDVYIHNDATESVNPEQSSIDSLLDILSKNKHEVYGYKHVIIAINLGIVKRLLNKIAATTEYSEIYAVLNNVEKKNDIISIESKVSVVSFFNDANFKIDETGVNSPFYDSIFKKIFSRNLDNPFYKVYLKDLEKGYDKVEHINYELLLNEKVRETIKYLLVRIQISNGLIISTRDIFNFIHDIIIPAKETKNNYTSYLPYLLFENQNKSDILKTITSLDPSRNSNQQIDSFNVEVYNYDDYVNDIVEKIGSNEKSIQKIVESVGELDTDRHRIRVNIFLRLQFLLDYQNEFFNNKDYFDFLSIISKNSGQVKMFAKLIQNNVLRWNGQTTEGFAFINNFSLKNRIAVPLKLNYKSFDIDDFEINMEFVDVSNKNEYSVKIDFDNYVLLKKISNGYVISNFEREQAMNFNNFVFNILLNTNNNENIIIGNVSKGYLYRIENDGIDYEVSEVEI
ncbi:DNA phosphorothioation-dependent restriction protein DptF [Dellaglioa algida]|nr:DNA phosphorothioation-dependent restriction protein DptF [Dellaglioa algida]MDK1723470.1 DNA phosphorothioation-dependent restriction protein DptF [Dellaglioa algida]